MDELQIREFAMADYERAYALWSSVEGMSLNESDTPESIAAFLKRNRGFSAVAVSAYGEIAGAILCGHNGRHGALNHLAVAKEFRGKGLGRRLVEFSLAKLVEAKIPRCNIFVYTDNQVGNRFWQDLGWKDPGTWKVMQKRLSPPSETKSSNC